MRCILAFAICLGGCTVQAVDATPGGGIVEKGKGTLSVDSSEVPLVSSCAEGQFVHRTAGGWDCQTPSDTLGGLSCTEGQVAAFVGGAWQCGNAAANGAWLASGNNLYYNGGDVGIGTAAPTGNLHVVSNGTTIVKSESSGTDARFQLLTSGAGGRDWLLQTGNTAGALNGRLRIYDRTAGVERVTFDGAGNVGIGTVLPQAMLDVNGVARLAKIPLASLPACGTAVGDGSIALTTSYVLCACKATVWVLASDGVTACK